MVPFVADSKVKVLAGIVFWLAVATGSLSLGACTTWKPIVLPSGVHGYAVNCSGTNLSWSHCYQKAGHACPHGYDVTQRLDAHGGKIEPGDLFGVLGGSVQDRSLLIQCRSDDSLPATAVRTQPATTGATIYPLGSGT